MTHAPEDWAATALQQFPSRNVEQKCEIFGSHCSDERENLLTHSKLSKKAKETPTTNQSGVRTYRTDNERNING